MLDQARCWAKRGNIRATEIANLLFFGVRGRQPWTTTHGFLHHTP